MYRLAVFFAFSALAFAPLAARAADVIAGPVEAEVVNVVDGDTLKVRAKIWLGQTVEVDVRLAGIDAPELHGACDREREAALAAKDALAALTGGGKVRLTDIRRDKFGGRVIAHVGGDGAEDLSAALLAQHFARAYGGGKRGGWCALAAR
ncbi:MAG: thermonuclease family protein [Parvibaculum sp.]|uniref:thermonuclease family protein n=1 Tax=Parvibaculum sp. TaxID=2024848 RepID=UPI00283EA500|nr:thermonuclease family protein [Parvibaculum sp.]MDR3498532.1 thermonuclease family protein [Parvibaculum sp.]